MPTPTPRHASRIEELRQALRSLLHRYYRNDAQNNNGSSQYERNVSRGRNVRFDQIKSNSLAIGRRAISTIKKHWKISLGVGIALIFIIFGLALGLGLKKGEPAPTITTLGPPPPGVTTTITTSIPTTYSSFGDQTSSSQHSTKTSSSAQPTTTPSTVPTVPTNSTTSPVKTTTISQTITTPTTTPSTTLPPITCTITNQRFYTIMLFNTDLSGLQSLDNWQKKVGKALVNAIGLNGTDERKIMVSEVSDHLIILTNYTNDVNEIDNKIDALKPRKLEYKLGSAFESILNGTAGSVPSGFKPFIMVFGISSPIDDQIAITASKELRKQYHLLAITTDTQMKKEFESLGFEADDTLFFRDENIHFATVWLESRVCEGISTSSTPSTGSSTQKPYRNG